MRLTTYLHISLPVLLPHPRLRHPLYQSTTSSPLCPLSSEKSPQTSYEALYSPHQTPHSPKFEVRWRDVEHLNGEAPGKVSPFVDILARLLLAFLGGSLFVGPKLIMRLPEVNLIKSLCTVSASVLLFAAFLFMFFKAFNIETMIATATHAAVLAVSTRSSYTL
ncbi:hypothetical protein N656DRAFT_781127 [Canariomyces notabilis]|uniref:DUF6594 domain-containing protein n=1 Tax=Canariomyces notabilis TaxID=2074819 RepID=A0AAN6QIW6_9PEZI|nr:hypothetical protein N656DRAFT_781127 [Canariomyces arenarius]